MFCQKNKINKLFSELSVNKNEQTDKFLLLHKFCFAAKSAPKSKKTIK